MSEGVSFKYDRVECVCVSYNRLSKVTFKVDSVFVRLVVVSGVSEVSECMVFVSHGLGVSSMCECVCVVYAYW